MKKLFVLQVIACTIAYLIGIPLGVKVWQVAVFAGIPIFLVGYVWFWWFRNVFFFRDPNRQAPAGSNIILSPADGRVMYVYPVKAGAIASNKKGKKINISELAKTEIRDVQGWLVGIYMSPFDVHYNRAPIDGEIKTLFYHRTGVNLPMVDLWEYMNFTLLRRAIDMFAAPFHLENERMTMQIRNEKMSCFLILIADQFVNKITRFFEESGPVKKGEKIAFIERGSQTDLFIPYEGVSFNIRPGQQVYAGETIIATYAISTY
jgi:phosphatidylserine decarboxylase